MTESTTHLLSVPDMSCDHCRSSIEGSVGAIVGVAGVTVDLSAKTVTVVGGQRADVVAAIDDAGFDVA